MEFERSKDGVSPVPFVYLRKPNMKRGAEVGVECGERSMAVGRSDREQTRDKKKAEGKGGGRKMQRCGRTCTHP